MGRICALCGARYALLHASWVQATVEELLQFAVPVNSIAGDRRAVTWIAGDRRAAWCRLRGGALCTSSIIRRCRLLGACWCCEIDCISILPLWARMCPVLGRMST